MRVTALAFGFIVGLGSTSALAENLAVCGSVVGKSYFAEKGIVSKKDSGWNDDKISRGKITLVKLGKNQYDLLFLDATGAIVSTIQDGGEVVKLRQGTSDFTFLIYYPGNTIEIYTFLVDNSGRQMVILIQSKGGDSALIHKSAVLVGECDSIVFD